MRSYSYKLLSNLPFKVEQITLNEITPREIEQIRIWRNEQMIVLRQKQLISKDEQIHYFKHNIWNELDSLNPNQILVGIYQTSLFIGYGGLVHIDWGAQSAEVSFLLDTKFSKNLSTYNVIFTEFLRGIEYIARLKLNLKVLTLETFSFRKEHISIIEKSGYTVLSTKSFDAVDNKESISSILHSKKLS